MLRYGFVTCAPLCNLPTTCTQLLSGLFHFPTHAAAYRQWRWWGEVSLHWHRGDIQTWTITCSCRSVRHHTHTHLNWYGKICLVFPSCNLLPNLLVTPLCISRMSLWQQVRDSLLCTEWYWKYRLAMQHTVNTYVVNIYVVNKYVVNIVQKRRQWFTVEWFWQIHHNSPCSSWTALHC